MEVFERMSTLIVEAAEYSSYREGTFGLTDEEIHAAYEADKNVYDTVSFRFAFFSGEPVEEESEATSEAASEVTSEVTSEAVSEAASEAVSEAASEAVSEETVDPVLMAEAEEKANTLASTAKTEEDFVAAIVANASEEDKEYYESDEASLIEDLAYDDIPDTFSGWLFADHVYGDTTVIESDTGYYVFLFLSRNTPDYTTVNVRHILFKPETDESGIASDQNWADAEAKAEAALAEFESASRRRRPLRRLPPRSPRTTVPRRTAASMRTSTRARWSPRSRTGATMKPESPAIPILARAPTAITSCTSSEKGRITSPLTSATRWRRIGITTG
jgi:chemotaxis protein histidine kinase CheA